MQFINLIESPVFFLSGAKYLAAGTNRMITILRTSQHQTEAGTKLAERYWTQWAQCRPEDSANTAQRTVTVGDPSTMVHT